MFAVCWIAALSCSASAAEATAGQTASDKRTSDAQSDPELEARFRSEAPKAWAELEAFTRKLRGAYTFETNESGPNLKRSRLLSCAFALNGPLFGLKETNKGTETVMATNGEYAFRIGRRADQPNGRYAIEWLERIGADEKADTRIRDKEEDTCAVVFAAWKLFGRSFSEFEQIPGFAFKGVRSVGGDVRVEFDCRPETPDLKQFHLTNVYLICDPINYWVLREYGADYREGDAKFRATLEYGAPLNGFPVVKAKHEKMWSDSGPYSSNSIVRTIQFEPPSRDTAPGSEFRLPHYNLPEPNFSGSGRRWSWLLFLNLGLFSLIVAYVLWRRRKRAAAQP